MYTFSASIAPCAGPYGLWIARQLKDVSFSLSSEPVLSRRSLCLACIVRITRTAGMIKGKNHNILVQTLFWEVEVSQSKCWERLESMVQGDKVYTHWQASQLHQRVAPTDRVSLPPCWASGCTHWGFNCMLRPFIESFCFLLFFSQRTCFFKYIQLPPYTEGIPKPDMMVTMGTSEHCSDLCTKQATSSNFSYWFMKTGFFPHQRERVGWRGVVMTLHLETSHGLENCINNF